MGISLANQSEVIIERDKGRYYLLIPYFWLLISLTSVTFLRYSGLQEADQIAGNKFNQYIFGILMILGGVIIFRRRVEIRRIIVSNIPLLLLLVPCPRRVSPQSAINNNP